MRKRHSYGATDNIVLDYRLKANGKEYLQGDEANVTGDFQLSIKVIGTAAIRQIDIIKNNAFLHNRQNLGREVSFTFVDNEAESGESLLLRAGSPSGRRDRLVVTYLGQQALSSYRLQVGRFHCD